MAAPKVASNKIYCFKDDSWASQCYIISIYDYLSGVHHVLPGGWNDSITWITFNLPVGTVVTMTDNRANGNGSSIADISNCGRTIDLVGNGLQQSLKLNELDMNDCLSGFFWRTVDTSLGALKVYKDQSLSGHAYSIFLSEWSPNDIHSIRDWYLNDEISSLDWSTLSDRSIMTLYENTDGTGRVYENVHGWGDIKRTQNLRDYDFNDCMSAFKWTPTVPKKEVIEPITISTTGITNSTQLQQSLTGTNDSSQVQQTSVALKDTKSQSITATTTETFQEELSIEISQSVGFGIGAATATTTITIGFKYDYTKTQTNTISTTKTFEVDVSQNFNVPAQTSFTASIVAVIGTLPQTPYPVSVTRWYDYPVKGGVQDPTNNNWWKRTEQMTVTLGGNVISATQTNFQAKALPKTT